jgi:hypothetical protein
MSYACDSITAGQRWMQWTTPLCAFLTKTRVQADYDAAVKAAGIPACMSAMRRDGAAAVYIGYCVPLWTATLVLDAIP